HLLAPCPPPPLPLHDALPISPRARARARRREARTGRAPSWSRRRRRPGSLLLGPRVDVRDRLEEPEGVGLLSLEGIASDDRTEADRKSTRLNSSHQIISYAVF